MLSLKIKSLLVLVVSLLVAGNAIAKTCRSGIPTSTPDTDFIIHNNGTVTHKKTSLMWKRCAEGQSFDANGNNGKGSCTGSATDYNWQQAMEQANDVNKTGFAGFTDWRVPNIKELLSIREMSCYGPAINISVFPNTLSVAFWSASAYASYSGYAWYVDFQYGDSYNDYDRDKNGHVRLVRGGQ